MSPQRKTLLITFTALAVLISIYFVTQHQRETKPQGNNETINNVVTIIQELDKTPKKKE